MSRARCFPSLFNLQSERGDCLSWGVPGALLGRGLFPPLGPLVPIWLHTVSPHPVGRGQSWEGAGGAGEAAGGHLGPHMRSMKSLERLVLRCVRPGSSGGPCRFSCYGFSLLEILDLCSKLRPGERMWGHIHRSPEACPSPPCPIPGAMVAPCPPPRIPLQVCQGNSLLVLSWPFGHLSPLEHRCVLSQGSQDAFQETGCRNFS